MKRVRFGMVVLVVSLTSLAQAQVPERAAEPGNPALVWGTLLVPISAALFLIYWTIRNRRGLQGPIDRSLQIAEEGLLHQRQAIALQEETNRLLARLIEERGGRA